MPKRTPQFQCGCLDPRFLTLVTPANSAGSEKRRPCRRIPKTRPRSICSGAPFSDHNSAAHSTAHRPPGGQHLWVKRKTRRSPQPRGLRLEHQAEQLREQRLEQLLEQSVVQRRIQAAIQREIQVAIQPLVQLTTQAITQPTILLPELRGELRRVLQETQPRFQREVSVSRYQYPVRWALDATTRKSWDSPEPAPNGDSPTERLRRTQRGTVPVFHSSPRPSPQGGEGERSEGEEGLRRMTKCQVPMTNQAPMAECQCETICADIGVYQWSTRTVLGPGQPGLG